MIAEKQQSGSPAREESPEPVAVFDFGQVKPARRGMICAV
ncbi:MAG: hypothetical protein ACI9V0_003090 [Parasphingorhabdus sp.]|jgi:hypothetical protein